jgi:phosphoserine phosphatase RsbU/P
MVLTSIGRRGALATAGVLIALTTLYVGAWIYYAGGHSQSARLGISYDFPEAGGALRVTAVEPGTPAEAAGLRAGDEIVALNGRPLVSERAVHDEILHAQPGTVVRLSVRQADGGTADIDATLVEPRPVERPFRVRFVTQAVTQGALRLYPVGFFIVLVVLLLQRPQDRNAWLVALLFAGFIAAAPLEPDLVHERGIRAFGLAYKTFFFTLAPALFFYLFAVFPVRSPIDRRWPWLKTPLVGVGAVLATTLAVQVVSADSWAPVQRALEGLTPTGLLLQVYSAAATLLGAVSLIGTYRATHDPQTRRRINVIVWGTAISLTPFMALQIAAGARSVDEAFGGEWFWLYAPAVLALFVLPISFAYAVVKYRVIEIPLLLKRSARYLLVQRGFVVLVALAGLVATVALVRLFPLLAPNRPDLAVPAGLVAGVGFGLALAWAGLGVRRRVSPWIDRKFFRSAYDARRILEHLAAHAAEATSREALAAEIEQCVTDALHPERLVVYFADAGGRLRALRGDPPGDLAAIEDAASWLPIETGDAPLAIEAREGEPHPVPPLERLAPECLAPITGRGGTLAGLLVLGRRRADEPYSAEDRRLLHAVCVQAGMALDNIALAERMAERLESERRAERELAIAQEVQRRLLPQAPPHLATLDLRGVCIQARAVGGDYYDFLDLGDGRLAIVLADISGKGISAALLMANLQAHLRAQSLAAHEDVRRLLTTIDRFMFEGTAAHHYATLFFGRYDERARHLVYANCGHNPPLLLRAGGDVEWLAPTAPAVGLFPTWACATGDVRLDAGDTLIIYSDGVTEAMADDDEEMFGDERLLEVATRLRGAPIDEVVTTIVREVERFSGTVQEDDLTLVVARAR